jgi:hypothetical protein
MVRAYYHFVRPHESLRVALVHPRERGSNLMAQRDLQLWQQAEPTDDGQRVRCSLTHCRRFQLESHGSQMQFRCHDVERSVIVPAEELGWASLQDEPAYRDCPMTK